MAANGVTAPGELGGVSASSPVSEATGEPARVTGADSVPAVRRALRGPPSSAGAAVTVERVETLLLRRDPRPRRRLPLRLRDRVRPLLEETLGSRLEPASARDSVPATPRFCSKLGPGGGAPGPVQARFAESRTSGSAARVRCCATGVVARASVASVSTPCALALRDPAAGAASPSTASPAPRAPVEEGCQGFHAPTGQPLASIGAVLSLPAPPSAGVGEQMGVAGGCLVAQLSLRVLRWCAPRDLDRERT